jgi:hypothetical protein
LLVWWAVINSNFLTLEITVILINAGLLLHFLKDRSKEKLTPAQIRALAELIHR